MRRYRAGTVVPPGLYWSPGRWEVKAVSGGSGLLEGEEGVRYLRVPGPLLPLVMLFGTVAGGLYIVFLPLVGFALVLGFTGLRVWQGVRHGLYHVMALFSPRWVPGECHFCGKARRRGDGDRGGSGVE